MSEERLDAADALIMLQAHRDLLPSTDTIKTNTVYSVLMVAAGWTLTSTERFVTTRARGFTENWLGLALNLSDRFPLVRVSTDLTVD